MSDPIQFEVQSPKGHRTILVRPNAAASVADTLRHEAQPLNTRCGQRGLCDGCIVELIEGRLVHRRTGEVVEANVQGAEAGGHEVRGCDYRVEGTGRVKIRVPVRSMLGHEPQVVTSFRLNVTRSHDPLWTQSDARAGSTPLGVAIDIGTTTVALLLVDMNSGEVVSQASGFNRQMHMGDDVLTRINLCSTDGSMLKVLQEAVVKQTLTPLLREAMRGITSQTPNDAAPGRIVCLVASGNTTMQHLLAGDDPSSMGIAPFTPGFVEHRVMDCREVGLEVPAEGSGNNEVRSAGGATSVLPVPSSPPSPKPLTPNPLPLHLLPSAAAYIGADLCAGVLATGLIYDEGPCLLIDVGTNGEIILKHGERLLGCATAAGPAFEGAKLASGIRAGRGAVETIHLEKDPFAIHTEVIGKTKAIGICGSAYVDFLAEARRIGLITPTGRFDRDEVCAPSAYWARSSDPEHGPVLRIARGAGDRSIVITEPDIASLLQAKAAIGAGVLTLLERVGMEPRDIKRVYLAGGFGMHINIANAVAVGLLPGFEPAQVQVVGNTSLAGAYLALLDRHALEELKRIGRRIEIIELNLDPGFEGRYIDQLALPT